MRPLLPLFLFILFSTVAQATHYKLFVLTGQSNSLGTTNGGETDPTSGTDPADQHVKFFWHNVENATTTIGTSGGVFTTLQDQQGGVYAGSATHWGPEMEFGRTLYRAGVRNFGIIKASRGGGGNTYWLKNSVDDHMYDHVIATVNTATTELTNNGHTFEIVGLLYLQGESDNSTEAAAAGTRLKALTDNLRADLSNAASMHTVCAGITAQGNADDDTTRTNQATIAASTSYIDYFENLDQQSNLAPDNLHLNKAAKIVLGNRFAQTFLNSGIVARHYGKLVFIGDSITQGGNGDNPSYRYQVFKNLADQGVPISTTAGYKFTGSISGGYLNSPMTTPDVNGQTFENNHDGHFGWRAFWINGRIPLPANRRSNNRGEGTIENWTGQASPQQYDISSPTATVPFPDPTASGTGVSTPYTAYTPDTAVIMIGINDISEGSSAAQVRDDIGTMIDQLQSSNANINIFISETLHTNQSFNNTVDTLNALLPALAASKSTSTSSVWVIETNTGYDPVSQTYDNIHPNTSGEEYVGNRISGGLGIIEMPSLTTDPSPVGVEAKAGEDLGCLKFEGDDIYNTGSYTNNWTATGDITATPVGLDDLRLHHPGSAGDVIDGTSTGWSGINSGVWSLSTRLKFDANANGFILWLGTGTHRILVEIYGDRTQDFGANSFNASHNNLDGNFHTFKVTHDPAGNVYHLWRDGVLLTPAAGAPYDQTAADDRLLLGDYTGGTFGNGFDVTFDFIDICRGYEGNEIYDGSSFINSWSTVGGVSASPSGTSDLTITNTSSGGSWLEGTSTEWQDENDGHWTWEARVKFNTNPNGFMIWLGTGSNRILVEVYADRTQDNGSNTFNISHNNTDGEFHTFRITHDPGNGVYHVWRDDVRLTPLAGVGYDSSGADERMILGDYTGGTFGNSFDVTFDYIRWDSKNAYLPPASDTDADGMPDIWEYIHFNDFISGVAGEDDDKDGKTNSEEYQADTDPNNSSSHLRIKSIEATSPDNYDITVPDTSPNRQYTLYESDDLGITDAWAPVSGQDPVIGNGGNLVFTPSDTDDIKFYRVKASTL
ncbi:MAG: hypothetical protein H7A51_19915 [Akkermansiaceae bacterium]|nr:hypothetical protein [Akkermansiaceae bacterium]